MRRRFTQSEQRIEAARELAADIAAARSEFVTLRRAVGLPAAFVFVARPGNPPTASFVFRLISGRCPRCVGVRPGCRCARVDAPPRRPAPWRTGPASGRGAGPFHAAGSVRAGESGSVAPERRKAWERCLPRMRASWERPSRERGRPARIDRRRPRRPICGRDTSVPRTPFPRAIARGMPGESPTAHLPRRRPGLDIGSARQYGRDGLRGFDTMEPTLVKPSDVPEREDRFDVPDVAPEA